MSAVRVVNVVGARPNLIKIAPLFDAYAAVVGIEPLLVHTGQHYDEGLSELFFRELGIPEPDVNLRVGSGSHAVQTAEIMKTFEPVLLEHRPHVVVVVGDVNSTVACGLVAVKLGIKLAHIEAGLRSFDRTMPEEINRILTDTISDLLFCSEPSGVENLRREGIPEDRIFLVGNVMIDTLRRNRRKAEASRILDRLQLTEEGYVLLTLHRPSNVDDPAVLSQLLDVFEVIQSQVPVIFPIHPRTRKKLDGGPLGQRVAAMKDLRLIDPAGYLDFCKLMASAKAVLTDSGGIQEETTVLGVPCLTLRENTERPVTAEIGTSRVVGTDPRRILAAWKDVQMGRWPAGRLPELWDGGAAQRIAEIILDTIA